MRDEITKKKKTTVQNLPKHDISKEKFIFFRGAGWAKGARHPPRPSSGGTGAPSPHPTTCPQLSLWICPLSSDALNG